MRKERRKQKEKLILNFILIILFLGISVCLLVKLYLEKNNEKDNLQQAKRFILEEYYNQNKSKEIEELKEYPKENIEEKYEGYDVIAKLEIPKIELETYVIEFSEIAMKTSVTKFWGPDPNKSGNFCIAGHNFRNKNMFHNLKKLQVGDGITLKDNSVGIVEYEVYDIYTVVPEDVSCLSQDTKGEKEITLITCTSDSQKRVIIKARERKV